MPVKPMIETLTVEWDGANLVGYDVVNQMFTGWRGEKIMWMRSRRCAYQEHEFERFLDRAAMYYVNCPYQGASNSMVFNG